MTTSTENRLLLSRYRAAETLSISLPFLDREVRAGRIRPVRLGRRVLYHREELERYAAANCRPVS